MKDVVDSPIYFEDARLVSLSRDPLRLLDVVNQLWQQLIFGKGPILTVSVGTGSVQMSHLQQHL